MSTASVSRVTIEQALPRDAKAVADVMAEVFGNFAEQFSPTALGWTIERILPSLADWLVARSGDQVVGVVRHEIDPLGHTFDALAVRKKWRQRGVGGTLVCAVEQTARARETTRVVVAVRTSLSDNRRFFSSLGYQDAEDFGISHRLFVKELS